MTVDISRVFSNTFAMVRERFFPILGLWAVFFGATILMLLVLGGAIGGTAALGADGGFTNPAAFGFGFIALIILFYIFYFYVSGAQQCSMIAMATPLERPSFGDALSAGFKGGLTFLGVIIMLLIGYFIAALIFGVFAGILSLLGEVGTALAVLLFLPAFIYLACRFSIIVPVIAVDRVYNPFTALNRTWFLTQGNVLRIFVVLLVVGVFTVVLFGALFAIMSAVIGGGMFADPASSLDGAFGAIFGVGLLMFVIFMVFSIISAALIASLHAEMSDTSAQELGETFQ